MTVPEPTPSIDRSRGVAILVGCWVLIALPLALVHPIYLNQDTYQYIAIANSYLSGTSWHIRDAYTVGPVIPGLVAVCKWLLAALSISGPNSDVAVVKLLAGACYITISLAAVRAAAQRSIGIYPVAVVFSFLLFTLPFEQDTLSLNGELVSAALLSVFLTRAGQRELRKTDYGVLTLLALLIVYTKLQSILLLALAVLTAVPAAHRKKLVLWVISAGIVAELALWAAGGGWTAKVLGMVRYIGAGQAVANANPGGFIAIITTFENKLALLWWDLATAVRYFPLAGILLIIPFTKDPKAESTNQSFVLWFLVSLVTVFATGRQYTHYLLYFIPLIFLFLPTALARTRVGAPRTIVAATLLGLMIAIRFCAIVPSPANLQGDRYWHLIPKQEITADVSALKAQLHLSAADTMFVHGWDFRFYSYFNKGFAGPQIAFVREGTLSPQAYINQLISLLPTYIFDVVNHTGLVREPAFSLSARPEWSGPISQFYAKIFDHDGLVVYRLKPAALEPKRLSTLSRTPSLHS